jgi:hypothetical protein
MERLGLLLAFGIVGVIGSFLLLVIGLILWREEQRRKLAKQLGQAAPDAQAEKKDGFALPRLNVGGLLPKRADPPGAHEVLRVLRDHLTGRLIVEIGGGRYRQASEIQDSTTREGLVAALHDLNAFAAGAPAPILPPTPTASAPPARIETPPVPPAAEGAAPVSASPPSPPPPAPPPAPAPSSGQPGYAPLATPSMNPFKQMQVLRERSKQPPPPPPKPITEQIDEILQARLTGTAHAQRGLHVRTGARGNAVFELDGRSYEAVDEVPDAEAQALIRAAIAEWEKRQSPP